ncbi:MAG TPA: lysozyme inhibitor LprI family protein [Rhodospirillales bacterium]|nr:lysozyme inhibitor LprI family protein [Rhodospirillales bacterium]
MNRSWRASVLAMLVLVALASMPVRAQAQQASFDCLQAEQPIEMVICSDPQLIGLDGELGAAFLAYRQRQPAKQRDAALAEQRAWLAERLSRCGVPAKGDEVADAVRWRAAPCLDEMYRARLAALGAPQTPLLPPPAIAAQPGFLHPACLWSLIEQDTEPATGAAMEAVRIPLAACAAGHRHIAFTQENDGGLSAPGASDGYRTWLSYRTVGRLPDGREVVIVWYNAGGSGQFSELYLLRRTPTPDGSDAMLDGELIAGGGDRCNGGIEAARLIDSGTLEIDYAVTPLDLLSEADEALADANMDSLALCAACCTGTVRRRLGIASRTEATVSATIDRLLSQEADGGGDEPAQACFDGILGKAAGTLPHTFPAGELKIIAQSFARSCVGNGGAPRGNSLDNR